MAALQSASEALSTVRQLKQSVLHSEQIEQVVCNRYDRQVRRTKNVKRKLVKARRQNSKAAAAASLSNLLVIESSTSSSARNTIDQETVEFNDLRSTFQTVSPVLMQYRLIYGADLNIKINSSCCDRAQIR